VAGTNVIARPAGAKVEYIQGLRAAAALLVAVSHLAKEVMHHDVPDAFGILPFLMSWQFGVDIFFVISGFIMFYVTADKPMGPIPAREFIFKRLIRIVPLYWFYTTLFLASLILVPSQINHNGYDLPYILSSYFFIPWPRPDAGTLTPLLGLGWTLNYEMLFYAVFSILILVRARHVLPILALLFGAAVIAGNLIPREDAAQLWYWTRSCILEFVLGVGVAMIFRSGRFRVSAPIGFALIAVGVVIWQVSFALWDVAEPEANIRGMAWGLAAALMVLGVSQSSFISRALETGGPKGLIQRVGDASYSLYLSHMFVVRVMTIALAGMFTGYWWIGYIVLSIIACTLVSLVSYRLLEQPVVALGSRLQRRKVASPST